MRIIKRLVVLTLCIFFVSTYFVQAEEYHRKGYGEDLYNVTQDGTQEQFLKNFMIELFLPSIVESTQEYYNDKSAKSISFNWEDNYNVVEVIQPLNQGKDRKYGYIITFTVTVHNGDIKKHKTFGTDTLTFGVHPDLISGDEIKGYPAIKLIEYKHSQPKK